MIGGLIALVLFAVFVSCGLAVQLCFERSRIISLEKVFRAPVFGISVIMLPVLFLSRSGFAITSVFGFVILAFGLAAFALIIRRRISVTRRTLILPLAIAAVALIYAGFPLFHFGLNWVAFSNGDSIFYQLTAMRLTEVGFFSVPTWQSIVSDTDPSQLLFFAQPLHGGDRPIFEMLLAVVSSFLHLKTTQVYMSVMLALFVTQVFSTCAIAASATRFGSWRSRRVPIIAMVGLLAIFAGLNALGYATELGPQLLGVSLLACLLSFRQMDLYAPEFRRRLPRLVTLTFLLATMCAGYPEMLPFLIASVSLCTLFGIRRFLSIRVLASLLGDIVCCLLVFALVLNWHLLALVFPIKGMFHGGTTATSVGSPAFPTYLLPTGLGALWGLVPVSTAGLTFFDQVSVALGASLTLYVIIGAIVTFRLGASNSAAVLVFFLVGALMFKSHADFGLYKLAMFAQPFLMTALVFFAAARKNRNWRLVLLGGTLALLVLSTRTSLYYLLSSQDDYSNTDNNFVNARNATKDRLLSYLLKLRESTSGRTVVSDLTNGIEMEYLRMFLSARYVVVPASGAEVGIDVPFRAIPFFKNLLEQAERIARIRSGYYKIAEYQLPTNVGGKLDFQQDLRDLKYASDTNEITLLAGRDLSIINLCPIQNSGSTYGQFVRADRQRNILLPVAVNSSSMGDKYESLLPLSVSLDGFHGGNVAAAPNLLFFEVLRPSQFVRILLDFTTTLNIAGHQVLPRIAVVGANTVYFPNAGEGRMRLLSPPVKPVIINHHAYVLIRFDSSLFHFSQKRTGLAALFGSKISIDPRKLIGFLRDVSAIGAEQSPDACAESDSAPEEFLHGVNYYSGIFEDGWLSPEVRLSLPRRRTSVTVDLAGAAPWINGEVNELTISSGNDSQTIQMSPGKFDSGPIELHSGGSDEVVLRFSKYVRPRPDDVRELGFLASKLEIK